MSPRELNMPSRFMVSLRASASPMPLAMTLQFVLTILCVISGRLTWVTGDRIFVYWMCLVPALLCLVLAVPFCLWCVRRWDETYSRWAFGSWVVEPHVRKRGRRRPSNDFAALAAFVKAHSQSHIVICGSYAGAWKRLTGVESFRNSDPEVCNFQRSYLLPWIYLSTIICFGVPELFVGIWVSLRRGGGFKPIIVRLGRRIAAFHRQAVEMACPLVRQPYSASSTI